jgi:prepilin signal peptidase PulO-like enzyme (type II secretory pathway)
VELGTGLLFAFLFWHFGWQWMLPVSIFYTSVLIVLGMIDLNHQLISTIIVFPIALVALIVNFFVPDLFSLHNLVFGLLGAAVGFIFLLLVMLLYSALRKREGMGLGDVYMAAMMGFMVGFPNIVVALGIGIILGGLTAIFLLVIIKKARTFAIPFGDFLAIGTIITLVWGTQILHWYLRLVKLE